MEVGTITLRSPIDCDLCRRTLLRGEHADVFRERDERRLVCELCTVRALRRRWVPEGGTAAVPLGLAGRLWRRLRRRTVAEPAIPIV